MDQPQRSLQPSKRDDSGGTLNFRNTGVTGSIPTSSACASRTASRPPGRGDEVAAGGRGVETAAARARQLSRPAPPRRGRDRPTTAAAAGRKTVRPRRNGERPGARRLPAAGATGQNTRSATRPPVPPVREGRNAAPPAAVSGLMNATINSASMGDRATHIRLERQDQRSTFGVPAHEHARGPIDAAVTVNVSQISPTPSIIALETTYGPPASRRTDRRSTGRAGVVVQHTHGASTPAPVARLIGAQVGYGLTRIGQHTYGWARATSSKQPHPSDSNANGTHVAVHLQARLRSETYRADATSSSACHSDEAAYHARQHLDAHRDPGRISAPCRMTGAGRRDGRSTTRA